MDNFIKFKSEKAYGFEITIDKAVLDDMELVELLAQLDTNYLVIAQIIEKMLGADQKKALYNHLKENEGRVKVTTVSEIIEEIFNYEDSEIKK